jgi:hypothetical protein
MTSYIGLDAHSKTCTGVVTDATGSTLGKRPSNFLAFTDSGFMSGIRYHKLELTSFHWLSSRMLWYDAQPWNKLKQKPLNRSLSRE